MTVVRSLGEDRDGDYEFALTGDDNFLSAIVWDAEYRRVIASYPQKPVRDVLDELDAEVTRDGFAQMEVGVWLAEQSARFEQQPWQLILPASTQDLQFHICIMEKELAMLFKLAWCGT